MRVFRKDTMMAKHSFWQTVKSVGAAFFGVQSEQNREQDFNHGKVSHFIVAGLLAVVLFIGSLILAVTLVMPN
tara:strand:+ start:371 stop:589 length:219 start_codon:yes stop_codon:yes gene_type:complete